MLSSKQISQVWCTDLIKYQLNSWNCIINPCNIISEGWLTRWSYLRSCVWPWGNSIKTSMHNLIGRKKKTIYSLLHSLYKGDCSGLNISSCPSWDDCASNSTQLTLSDFTSFCSSCSKMAWRKARRSWLEDFWSNMPAWMTFWSTFSLYLAAARIFSSTLLTVQRRSTRTSFCWPMRWARSWAWRSWIQQIKGKLPQCKTGNMSFYKRYKINACLLPNKIKTKAKFCIINTPGRALTHQTRNHLLKSRVCVPKLKINITDKQNKTLFNAAESVQPYTQNTNGEYIWQKVAKAAFKFGCLLLQWVVCCDKSGAANICLKFHSFIQYFAPLNRNCFKYILHETKHNF